MIAGYKEAYANLGDVLLLGMGVTGKAVLAYLEPMVGSRVNSITIAEDDSAPIEGHFDLCIASPGISQFSDMYIAGARASAQIIGEVEFAWRESTADSKWVSVTGTNGKTTTTALVSHLLQEAGFNARCVGNIGDTCIDAVARDNAAGTRDAVYVAETSSYQLASTVNFAPDVAVVLNITPDHLAWHRSHENYAEAKWKSISNIAASHGIAILNATDDEVRAKVREIKADANRGFSYIPLGAKAGIDADMRAVCGAENASFVRVDGTLAVAFGGEEFDLCNAADLQIKGEHNIENALAAASAAIAIGANAGSVAQSLTTFKPLEHRIEPAGEIAGVRFFNDSKATNTDATLKALVAFRPDRPIILLGGRDKGTDLEELVEQCASNAKAVVVFGEAADRFYNAFVGRHGALHRAEGMAEAFECAMRLAQPGDIVLLSPACASFDEFSCFEERGDTFKRMVDDTRAKLED